MNILNLFKRKKQKKFIPPEQKYWDLIQEINKEFKGRISIDIGSFYSCGNYKGPGKIVIWWQLYVGDKKIDIRERGECLTKVLKVIYKRVKKFKDSKVLKSIQAREEVRKELSILGMDRYEIERFLS